MVEGEHGDKPQFRWEQWHLPGSSGPPPYEWEQWHLPRSAGPPRYDWEQWHLPGQLDLLFSMTGTSWTVCFF